MFKSQSFTPRYPVPQNQALSQLRKSLTHRIEGLEIVDHAILHSTQPHLSYDLIHRFTEFGFRSNPTGMSTTHTLTTGNQFPRTSRQVLLKQVDRFLRQCSGLGRICHLIYWYLYLPIQEAMTIYTEPPTMVGAHIWGTH